MVMIVIVGLYSIRVIVGIDWLLYEFTYLQFFSTLVPGLLVYCYFPAFETRKASVKSRITLNWLSLRPPNIAEISHQFYICVLVLSSSFIMFRWMGARLQDFWSYCRPAGENSSVVESNSVFLGSKRGEPQ